MASAMADISDCVFVLERDIPWETYMTARLISDKELQLIRRYDKRSDDVQAAALDENGQATVEAFLSVLRNVTKDDTVQYVLAVLLKLLAVNPARSKLFTISSTPDPYSVFLRLLQRQDWFTQEKACKLLTAVLEGRVKRPTGSATGLASDGSVSISDTAEQAMSSFVDWLCSQLRRPSSPTKSVPAAVSALASVLKEKVGRLLLLKAGGIQLLPPLMKSSNLPANSQLLYELCICAWQLSYVKPAAQVMLSSGMSKQLVEVCRSAQKEKVFRAALATLKNLVQYEDLHVAGDLVEAGLTKVVATRMLQTWGDEDVVELLRFMDEKLREGVMVTSNFEKYRKEVLSGTLDWGPMHTSADFWKLNVNKFEDRDFQVLRVLLKLIEASREVHTLAVGCHDLGQFIMHHPQGRHIITDLRGKELVMRLMAHPDLEVQKQALLCVQKIMLSKDKLDFLGFASG